MWNKKNTILLIGALFIVTGVVLFATNEYHKLQGGEKNIKSHSDITAGFDAAEVDVNAANASNNALDHEVITITATPINEETAPQELVDAHDGKSVLDDRLNGDDEHLENGANDSASKEDMPVLSNSENTDGTIDLGTPKQGSYQGNPPMFVENFQRVTYSTSFGLAAGDEITIIPGIGEKFALLYRQSGAITHYKTWQEEQYTMTLSETDKDLILSVAYISGSNILITNPIGTVITKNANSKLVNNNVDTKSNAKDLENKVEALEEVSLRNETQYKKFNTLFNDTDKIESFIFYTDPHLMGINGEYNDFVLRKYIDALDKAQYSVPVNYILCGGDWLNHGDTKTQAYHKLGIVDSVTNEFLKNHYHIMGNHDTGYQGSNYLIDPQKYTEDILPDNTLRNLLFHKQGNLYYKFEGKVSTTFVLNTGLDWWDWLTEARKTQLDWLAAALQADDSTHKAIAMHLVYANFDTKTLSVFADSVGKMIKAFNERGTANLGAYGGNTYDFSNASGYIEYVIAGHSHSDYIGTLGEVPCILTRDMRNGDTPTFDLVLVNYSTSKINLIRIGTGEDREIEWSMEP